MGSMDRVVNRFPEVVAAFDSGGWYDSVSYDDYITAVGDRRQTVVMGDRIDLGPSMEVEVLHADEGDTDNENNNSVVIRLSYGDFHALIGGDCESALCERAVDPGPIDVYKVHHHGSSDGSARGFLNAMEPAAALISVGLDNVYGHPDADTLSRLETVGTTVWRTDLDGDLVVRSDGVDWTVNGE